MKKTRKYKDIILTEGDIVSCTIGHRLIEGEIIIPNDNSKEFFIGNSTASGNNNHRGKWNYSWKCLMDVEGNPIADCPKDIKIISKITQRTYSIFN